MAWEATVMGLDFFFFNAMRMQFKDLKQEIIKIIFMSEKAMLAVRYRLDCKIAREATVDPIGRPS